MLDKLAGNHRQLEACGKRLATLLDAPVPDDEALAAARWSLATTLMQHMSTEDRHLFANLAEDPRPGVAALIVRYRAEYADHVARYADHTKRWTAEAVAREWRRYGEETREQLRLMAQRIAKVEAELFPLARTISIDEPGQLSTSWAREAFAVKDSVAVRR